MAPQRKVVKIARTSSLNYVPSGMVDLVKRAGCFQLLNDIIVFAVDILPDCVDDFVSVVKAVKPKKKPLTRFFAKNSVSFVG